MSAAIKSSIDRRERPRATIDSHINYKLHNSSNQFSAAKMVDLSQTGVLIKLHQELDEYTQLTLQIKSDTEDEEPIEIIAEVVRIEKSSNDEQYSYGCKILDIQNF